MQKTSAHTLEYMIEQEEENVRYHINQAEYYEAMGWLEAAIDARDCVGLANLKIEQLRNQKNERDTNNN